jgi:hypothetical protein
MGLFVRGVPEAVDDQPEVGQDAHYCGGVLAEGEEHDGDGCHHQESGEAEPVLS